LTASLVFVGCQNYDDQFDDLNAQISALKSQVDGLSSLSGQVTSLAGTISGLQAGVSAAQSAANAAAAAGNAATASADAATAAATASTADLSGLEASLASLADDVAAVQASLATAATASAVTALQAEIDAIESDLDDLLSSSNIYSTAVTVNNASSLDAALALGNKLNVLNEALTITVSTAMDITKVQTLVDRVITLTGTLSYTASAATIDEVTFNNLTSAANIDVKQPGGYQFKNLVSAQTINLRTDYTTKVTNIDFGSLATATTINNGTAATLSFPSATNMDLGSLTRYGSALTIAMKDGGTLDIASLEDKTAAGVQSALDLTISGAASVNISKLDGLNGSLSFTDVATVTVDDYNSTITINDGVETLTVTDSKKVAFGSSSSLPVDLKTASIDLARDDYSGLSSDATAALEYDSTSNAGNMTIDGFTNLTSLTITGHVGDIVVGSTATGNANLTSLVIDAEGSDLSVINNDNLTTLTTTGSKFGDVTVSGNADLATINFGITTKLRKPSKAGAIEKAAVLTVTDNTSLTSLTSAGDDYKGVVVTGNTKLATIDFSGLGDDGSQTAAAGGSYAHIWNNKLNASLVRNATEEASATVVTNAASDLGSYTDVSGMASLQTWLDHAIATPSAANGIYVFYDEIDKYETNSVVNGSYSDAGTLTAPSVTSKSTAFTNRGSLFAVVAIEAAEYNDEVPAVYQKQTVVFPVSNLGNGAAATTLTAGEGIAINVGGVSVTFSQGASNAGSTVTTVSDLVTYIQGATNWGSDLTVTAANDGYERAVYRVNYTTATGAAGSTSLAGSDTALQWYLGSSIGHASGTLTMADGDGSAAIAQKLATSINTYAASTGNTKYGAYHNGGAFLVVYGTESAISGYPDSVMPGQSFPDLNFNIDAKESSTSIRFGTYTVSNTLALNSDFYLSTSKNIVKGVRVTLQNNTTNNWLQNQVITVVAGTGSSIVGSQGFAGTASITNATGTTSAKLTSGTHHDGNTTYTVPFSAYTAASGGDLSQAAAATDRTGWLG